VRDLCKIIPHDPAIDMGMIEKAKIKAKFGRCIHSPNIEPR